MLPALHWICASDCLPACAAASALPFEAGDASAASGRLPGGQGMLLHFWRLLPAAASAAGSWTLCWPAVDKPIAPDALRALAMGSGYVEDPTALATGSGTGNGLDACLSVGVWLSPSKDGQQVAIGLPNAGPWLFRPSSSTQLLLSGCLSLVTAAMAGAAASRFGGSAGWTLCLVGLMMPSAFLAHGIGMLGALPGISGPKPDSALHPGGS